MNYNKTNQPKANIFKRLILPVKLFFACLFSSILTLATYATIFYPLQLVSVTAGIELLIYIILPIFCFAVSYYTTFKWLFYDADLNKWKW